MKIITWNCNMAFRRKAGFVLEHRPDILVVPECEHPDKLVFDKDIPKPTSTLWFGSNMNKGLGIFSYCKFRFKVFRGYDPRFKMVVPINVKDGEIKFTLFAIWANNPGDKDGQYVTQVWKAINHYDKLLSQKKKVILVGDFNSNTIWDKPRREGNHSTVVRKLEEKGIYSVYHKFFDQTQGCEQHPTLYLYRKKDKPYHLDYCFASKEIAQDVESVEIGDHEKWCKYSDHVPVMVNFNRETVRRYLAHGIAKTTKRV